MKLVRSRDRILSILVTLCEGDIYDHNCTNCLPGYEGRHCERNPFLTIFRVLEIGRNISESFVSEFDFETLADLIEFIHLIERRIRLTSVQSSVIVCDSREVEEAINRNLLQTENDDRDLANKNLETSDALLSEAMDFIQNVSFILQRVAPLQTLLENATEQLEYHRGILARLNPRYIQKFVIPAADHAEHLSQQAIYLSNATQTASQFPLLAAKVYDDIINNIEGAELVAMQTYNTADRAFTSTRFDIKIKLFFFEKKSQMLIEEIVERKLDVENSQITLGKQKDIIENISDDIKLVLTSLMDFKTNMDVLPRSKPFITLFYPVIFKQK
ncbi:laminin subunit alpha-1 [Caerostris extrusa]|uniref:Laminin subunit alpha-1 n=1 Tax=Caerostris extrusa TaxID=172846 RepID=A0AAV4YH39_CAEEX|nr:laminin subunit alpha-1 [Caerostris extrusa]